MGRRVDSTVFNAAILTRFSPSAVEIAGKRGAQSVFAWRSHSGLGGA